SRPLHPYTRALMAAVPTLDPHSEPQALVQGEIPIQRRSSICFPTCATTAGSRFCLSPTTSGWWSIYVTMWR
ncbi:hypothetical protein CPA58_16765, partial [Klebsiella pneumoniae]